MLLPLIDMDKSAELSSNVNASCPYSEGFRDKHSRNNIKSFNDSVKVPVKKRTHSQRDLTSLLLKQLQDGSDVVRTHAATDLGMGSEKSERVLLALGRASHFDSSKWVRRAAVKSMEKVGGVRAIPLLERALNDKNRWVVYSAKRALGRLKWNRARASMS